MIRAVLRDGVVCLDEPLPPDWRDGQVLRIDTIEEPEPTPEEIRRDFALLEAMCAENDPEDDERLQRALDEAELESKAASSRKHGQR